MIRPRQEWTFFFHSFHKCLFAHFHKKITLKHNFNYKIKFKKNNTNTKYNIISFIFITKKPLNNTNKDYFCLKI